MLQPHPKGRSDGLNQVAYLILDEQPAYRSAIARLTTSHHLAQNTGTATNLFPLSQRVYPTTMS